MRYSMIFALFMIFSIISCGGSEDMAQSPDAGAAAAENMTALSFNLPFGEYLLRMEKTEACEYETPVGKKLFSGLKVFQAEDSPIVNDWRTSNKDGYIATFNFGSMAVREVAINFNGKFNDGTLADPWTMQVFKGSFSEDWTSLDFTLTFSWFADEEPPPDCLKSAWKGHANRTRGYAIIR